MNNKGGPTLLGSIIFIFWPSFIAFLMCLLICFIFNLSGDKDIFTSAVPAIIGYSATASFFFLALPRTGFLKILDRRKHTPTYTLSVMIPAIVGITQMFFLYLKSTGIEGTLFISNLLFLMTVFQFLWSLGILILIIRKVRHYDNVEN